MAFEQLKKLVNDDLNAVNNLIVSEIQSQIGLIDELAHHIVESGGKRLRPLLVLLSSHACGYKGSDHIALAAIIEFFHTATLLHDDVVDESTLRRGKETANEIWGSKASILVGDFLFTQAFQLMINVKNWPILQLLSDTVSQITCGEVKQLTNKNTTIPSENDYFDIIRAKTAVLFAASAAFGPLLINADHSIKNGLYDYGLHLGNAFQLIDDALDYCSDAQSMGKNIGDDLADGKATLPLIYALKNGTTAQQQLIRECLRTGGLQHFNAILQIIQETNAIEYTRKIAAIEIDKAISALQVLPDTEYKNALIELAEAALARNS